jgi:membrane protein
VPLRVVASRTWRAFLADNLLGRAAELSFYFLFALFPTLLSANAILGLIARSASHIYAALLGYLSLVMPTSALGSVIQIFQETTVHASSGKVTFGLIAAIWSASVGISAIQDTLNGVYKVPETRSYFAARLSAIAVTILLTVSMTLSLASMLGADFCAKLAHRRISHQLLVLAAVVVVRLIGWTFATLFLTLSFAIVYFWAPDVKKRKWHWLTVGAAFGIAGWLLASLGLRVYLHFFDNYSVTYGSLGAVIILLTWFYISGLMLLLGAEINSEIEAAVAEKRLASSTVNPPAAMPETLSGPNRARPAA